MSSRNPRKLVLSPTRISTYLACPLMYKFVYIDKLSRFYYKPKAAHSFGASLHRALQEFHSHGGASTQTSDQLKSHLRRAWVEIGYESLRDEQAYFENGLRILQGHHSTPLPSGTITLFTERQLKQDMGAFVLAGRIDRLDQHIDDRIEVIDYKSGRVSVTEEEVRNDLAMNVYQLLAKLNYPNERVTGSILCLTTGDKATVELTPNELTQVQEHIRGIAPDIMSICSYTEIEPLPKAACAACDFKRLCLKMRATSPYD